MVCDRTDATFFFCTSKNKVRVPSIIMYPQRNRTRCKTRIQMECTMLSFMLHLNSKSRKADMELAPHEGMKSKNQLLAALNWKGRNEQGRSAPHSRRHLASAWTTHYTREWRSCNHLSSCPSYSDLDKKINTGFRVLHDIDSQSRPLVQQTSVIFCKNYFTYFL